MIEKVNKTKVISQVKSINDYLKQVPQEKKPYFNQLRSTILSNLPQGFVEEINYNMIGYVVPHSLYPNGYHCNPKLPLPFINIACQKNFIGLYHMGIYANPKLLYWFTKEYPKYCPLKLDMGKSCIRFKKIEVLPYKLIAKLIQKMSIEEWIILYEKNIKK